MTQSPGSNAEGSSDSSDDNTRLKSSQRSSSGGGPTFLSLDKDCDFFFDFIRREHHTESWGRVLIQIAAGFSIPPGAHPALLRLLSMKRFPSNGISVEPLETRTLLDAKLLIGTWNVDIADAGGGNRDAAAFQDVFRAMGQEDTYAQPQPPDLLTVTEVRSNAVTGSTNDTEWLTQQLDAVYGPGMYAHPAEDAASDGGGTEGVIYNTQSLALLEVRFVGTAGTSGPARQEYRYRFRPVSAPDGSTDFYVYVGHYKAGTTSTDRSRRYVEAQQVRADGDALGPGVPILYTGDFNSENSNEAALQTLLGSGNGQASDPINRLGNWGHNTAFVDADTIAGSSLTSRLNKQHWSQSATQKRARVDDGLKTGMVRILGRVENKRRASFGILVNENLDRTIRFSEVREADRQRPVESSAQGRMLAKAR
jgi:hypothetical protein